MTGGEEYTIKKVEKGKDGWTISTNHSTCFFLESKWGVKPKAKDNIILYTQGFSLIRGLDINGVNVFYKSDQQLDQEHQEFVDRMNKEKEERFKKEKNALDARFNALPEFFKDRIRRFRTNNPNFRVEFESYEMFCIEEAINIANVLKTKEEVQRFAKADWKEQKKMVPSVSDDHSGNTFGAACQLAYLYLDNPENVVICHGSLSTLVGSEAFGDIDTPATKLRQERRKKLRSIEKHNEPK